MSNFSAKSYSCLLQVSLLHLDSKDFLHLLFINVFMFVFHHFGLPEALMRVNLASRPET